MGGMENPGKDVAHNSFIRRLAWCCDCTKLFKTQVEEIIIQDNLLDDSNYKLRWIILADHPSREFVAEKHTKKYKI